MRRRVEEGEPELVVGFAAYSDELTGWAQQRGNGLFQPTDTRVAAQFGQVLTWVMRQRYEPAAINTFVQVADFYLIAHALGTQLQRGNARSALQLGQTHQDSQRLH